MTFSLHRQTTVAVDTTSPAIEPGFLWRQQMRIKIVNWVATLLGVTIRINGLPYGAPFRRGDTD